MGGHQYFNATHHATQVCKATGHHRPDDAARCGCFTSSSTTRYDKDRAWHMDDTTTTTTTYLCDEHWRERLEEIARAKRERKEALRVAREHIDAAVNQLIGTRERRLKDLKQRVRDALSPRCAVAFRVNGDVVIGHIVARITKSGNGYVFHTIHSPPITTTYTVGTNSTT